MSFISWLHRHHLMRVSRKTRIVCAVAALAAVTLPSASAASAGAYIDVYGGPTYTPGVGGFKDGGATDVNDAGMAVGYVYKYNSSGGELGGRAFRWNGSGAAATELGNLGTTSNGKTESTVFAINNAGTAVGSAEKYDSSGDFGSRAVRWNPSDTAATELGNLGTTPLGFTYSYALFINDLGTAVGYAGKYNRSGGNQGYRAVRWDASGTAATELGNLGTGNQFGVSGFTNTFPHAVNEVGTAVGWATKFDGAGVEIGVRAVRWGASGTAATELDGLGADSSGRTESVVYAIDSAGTTVGNAKKFDSSGMFLGYRAVRWDSSGTAVTELGNLGVSSSGFLHGAAEAINDAGTIVGYSDKYDGLGAHLGARAVRWDASGTAAIELGNLGTDASGYTSSEALAVNDAGIAIGYSDKYDGAGTYLGRQAVYWGIDRVAVELNTLVDPESGWTLDFAIEISDTGWIAGHATFDPDGFGGQAAYNRMFLMHVPATAVPEPATVALFGVALVGLGVASRRRVRLRRHQLKCTSGATRIVCAAAVALAAMTFNASSASAAYVSVYGGPTYTLGVGVNEGLSVTGVNDAGVTVGNIYEIPDLGGCPCDSYALRWDGSEAPASVLAGVVASDINEAGTAVGHFTTFVGTGYVEVAVRWDASGTAVTELGSLGTHTSGWTESYAYAINDAGTAVGSAAKFNDSGGYLGPHAVRWNASGTVATELGNLGTASDDSALGAAYAINNAGAVVGFAGKYDDSGAYFGPRAVRWDASGTVATELGNLGTYADGWTANSAQDINEAGTAVGYSWKVDGAGTLLGNRAVRWDATGTAATELENLGTNGFGRANSYAVDINDAGTAVGYAEKYDGLGKSLGARAVRWDASGAAATELGNLGTNSVGLTGTSATAINAVGFAVGSALDYDDFGTSLGPKAVYWDLDGVAVDLNTLIDPASGWSLYSAHAVSNTGWIGGSGLFDPDGAGGQDAYARLFLLQLPAPSDLPGDYNGNGIVDAADYTVWRDNLGGATLANRGPGITGPIGSADYDVWKSNFGDVSSELGAGSGAALPSAAQLSPAVPEPATVVLFGVALVGLGAVSRRRVRRNVVHHLMRDNRATYIVYAAVALAAMTFNASSASAAYVSVHGGPTFTPGLGGFKDGGDVRVNDAGTAVGNVYTEASRPLRLESLEDRSLLSFTPVASLAVGAIVVTADFNNDTYLDLATEGGNTVSVRLGDGNGGFGAATPFATGSNQGSMAVGDFNDDGNLDLAIRPGKVLLGNGDGAFQPPIINPIFALPPRNPQSVGAADFDGDGNSDFAYTYTEGTSGQGWVGVRISNGEGGFATSNEYDLYNGDLYEGVGADGLAVADLNGDGKPDIVTTDPFGGTVNVMMGSGNGTFSLYLGENFGNFDTGPFPRAVAVGDFTGDGIPDLVTAGWTVDILPGLGEGDFGISLFGPPINQSANSSGMTTVAAADFNGDGKLDVVAADPAASTVSVFLGFGNGTLTAPIDHAVTGSSPSLVAVGDFNGDGRPDVAAGNVLLNDGNWPAIGPTLPGDYNQNGIVDAADYTVWRDRLGQTFQLTNENPDDTNPGVVDQEDYTFWKSQFGQSVGSGGAASATAVVPEPTAVGLLVLAAAIVELRRRRPRLRI